MIKTVDPRAPDVRAVLAKSHSLMQNLFDPEACHFLDIEALCVPQIQLFGLYEDDRLIGTGGLFDHGNYGEIKSMFTLETARGKGVAGLLLAHIETSARAKNHAVLRLETGDVLAAARALYAKSGFTERGPFGSYAAHPASVFMEKPLT